ncbi:VOC family protein [Marinoscillum furvescens]|uniref:3-demethylubiquinone-9 3-methyltransferase n=1 Tax=Marinoscillum furvescens DSM 4134 TaxID=1122208 RepID=A0A3D9L2E0_MARFU|nr:VOC family protein [Marinoscillum furvescens]RED95584.1 3-demethylubiquinone-9 3-methyltransferase [Marinoscillum furvescens DSM 4134]
MTPQGIIPFLWFENHAEQAIHHYLDIFPNSSIEELTYWPEGSPFPANAVQSDSFTLNGLKLHAFDAGPHHHFMIPPSYFNDTG